MTMRHFALAVGLGAALLTAGCCHTRCTTAGYRAPAPCCPAPAAPCCPTANYGKGVAHPNLALTTAYTRGEDR